MSAGARSASWCCMSALAADAGRQARWQECRRGRGHPHGHLQTIGAGAQRLDHLDNGSEFAAHRPRVHLDQGALPSLVLWEAPQ